jgi:hypothetical protein
VGGEKMREVTGWWTDFAATMTHPQAEYPGESLYQAGGMFTRLYMENTASHVKC